MRKKIKAFTLLEVLISLVLFVAGVISVVSAFSVGLLASSDFEDTQVALLIAQSKMEEIRKLPFSDLADSGPLADSFFPRFNVTVNVTEGQDPATVDVTVSWQKKGEATSISLATLKADY